MSNFTFTIQAPELAAAIAALAAALGSAKLTPANPTQMAAPAVTPTIPQTSSPAQVAPAVASAPMSPAPTATTAAPVTPAANPAPVAPPIVPTAAAPTYNRDQIMTAGAALIDAGKIAELMGLLGAFGVQAVTQLKTEQLGAFATELRKLGAQI